MARVAAVDCGTNSIRLLIADRDDTGALTDIVRTMTVVRLGQGVDTTGELAAEALERTFAAARKYAKLCDEHGVEALRFVATSATRDARNRQDFVDGIQQILGVTPEVVSGEEEAALSFRGAIGAVPDATQPVLVVDLGGGSTELVLGEAEPRAAFSMNIGCVRMTERHLRGNPPSESQINAAVIDIRDALDEASQYVPLGEVKTLVGLAGSITTVTAHALELSEYDRSQINGATLSIDAAVGAAESLLYASRDTRAALPFMHPGRVDVIGAGALVWREVMERVRRDVENAGGTLESVTTSEHDILDGIAMSVEVA